MDGVTLHVSTSHETTFELMTATIPTLRQFLTVCANILIFHNYVKSVCC